MGMFTGTKALAATSYTVTTLSDTAGSCSGSNCTTLRAAIVAANSSAGNSITFAELSGTITLNSGLPAITQSMTITGPGVGVLTVSGNNTYQILNISSSSATVAISGLTFANGSSLHATNGGGGAINSAGKLIVTNVTFSGNTAGGGSAGAISSDATLTVTNCTFSSNTATYGGAIASYSTATVADSTFAGNSAEYAGGALFNEGPLTVINSTFSGNNSSPSLSYNPNNGVYGGGAIVDFGSSMAVTNSTFSGNSTAAWGGAIYSQGGTMTLENNIFTVNTASLAAGIAAYNTANVSYNLFYQNRDAGGAEDDCSNCTNNTNAITGSNPNLLPLGFYGGPTETMLPQPGSPAICAGDFADVPNGVTTDQRGFPLTSSACNNGGVDLGSVQAGSLQVNTTADSNDGSCDSVCSLRDAITEANAIADGADITFAPGVTGTITLTSNLPYIETNTVIIGPGAGTITISGNNSYQIFNILTGTVAISGLTLANANSAIDGGGAIFNSGALTVTNCELFGNSGSEGGAIYNFGTLTVSGSTFSENSGGGGGAIANLRTLIVDTSTFSGNSSTASGGAIFSYEGVLTVNDSTFSGNSAALFGGAIYNYIGTQMTADNNIFTGNTAESNGGAGIIGGSLGTSNADHNLFYQNLDGGSTEDDCNACTSSTNAITGVNPLLAVLGGYGGPTQTLLPQPGSPAICAGSAALIPSGLTTDQRGFSRTTTYSGTSCVDLGAVQTSYTAIAFSNSSYTALQDLPVSPAPVVSVTENGQNIGGVPVTLDYNGTGSPTGLGPVTTVSGAGATFNSLEALTPAEGTLSVSLPITAAGNAVQPTPLAASASLNIIPNTQAIAFSPPNTLTYGTAPITLTATGGGSGNPVTFSLDPASTTGAALLNGSTLTINGAGTIVIDANQAAGNGYLAAPQVQRSIVVNPATLTITASSPTLTYGSAVPTITPIFGTFFNGDTSAVLTKQPTCITTYTTTSAAGSSPSTSCSGAAAANYTFNYINGSVTVNRATPTITWATPAAIVYGTVLSTTQLDAAASVTGSFIYSPAAGTVPAVGNDILSVAFSPADTTNYTAATASVTLTVNPPPGFALSASATSLSIAQNSNGTSIITVSDVGGFTGAVALAASGLPSGVTASFAAGTAAGTQVLTLSASPTASLGGPATVTVTGTSGALSATTTVLLTVTAEPTFGPSGGTGSDGAITLNPGATTGNTSTISVAGTNGYLGTVNLSCSISPIAANDPATCSLSPASVTLNGNTAQTSTLTVTTTAATTGENEMKKLLWPSAGGTALGLVLLFGVPRRRRNWLTMVGLAVLFTSIGVIGCSGGSGGGGSGGGRGGGNTGTSAGIYTVTVTGTGTSGGSSNPVTATVGTVTLTVN